ncbi:MAG: glycosyltransferase family 2 protein [Deltaproteobacteria bacterium]|nr:glycosyltransferase family 2 protein [Deltaproteobacteria bacterium]
MLLTANTTQFPNSPSAGRTGNRKNMEDDIHDTDAKASRLKMTFLLKILIFLSMIAVVTAACLNWEELQLGRDLLREGPLGESFAILIMTFLIINLLAFVWRVALVIMYRATPAVSGDRLPTCTVVVPAYNEGKQVLKTLRSIADGDYPEDKIHIIVIDDGSIDDTWFWIKKAKKELGSRLKTIRLPKNAGKRHALHEGFKQSRGEVLITVDSDSIVDPQTLRCMVSPFVENPMVGAVAGNVRVLNTREGVIPRMLDVSFLFSFDFLRASQSMVDTVICTPGALSAYRRDVVLKVLPTWLGQKFFGKPANIGEDRAMTNLILRQGYSVHYQKNATVYTNVPVRYKNLCKMFIRWARSNIRETLVMSTFIFTRFRKKSATGARINFALQFLTMVKSPFLMVGTLGCLFFKPFEFGLSALVGVLVYSTLSAVFYWWRCRSSEGLWAYAYGLFWTMGLFWIPVYALITPHRTGWLTRQSEKKMKVYPAKKRHAQRLLPVADSLRVAIPLKDMDPGIIGIL